MGARGLMQAIAAFLLSSLMLVAAQAALTMYTFRGIATGRVGYPSASPGPLPFTDVGFSFTASTRGDRVSDSDGVFVVPLEEVAQITLRGLGDFIAVPISTWSSTGPAATAPLPPAAIPQVPAKSNRKTLRD